jgi:hypothetical protein
MNKDLYLSKTKALEKYPEGPLKKVLTRFSQGEKSQEKLVLAQLLNAVFTEHKFTFLLSLDCVNKGKGPLGLDCSWTLTQLQSFYPL